MFETYARLLPVIVDTTVNGSCVSLHWHGVCAQMLFLPTSLVLYAALVTHHWLDVGPFAASPDPYELPAQVRFLVTGAWSLPGQMFA